MAGKELKYKDPDSSSTQTWRVTWTTCGLRPLTKSRTEECNILVWVHWDVVGWLC